jgi:hypothetical protein
MLSINGDFHFRLYQSGSTPFWEGKGGGLLDKVVDFGVEDIVEIAVGQF